MEDHKISMDKIVSLCKRRGFVFQSSEIYGGQAGAWDYGPLGVELKKNIQNAWWKEMTQLHDNIVGLDAAILMHPRVWEASGHVANFSDPLVDCKQCKMRFRADTMDQKALEEKKCPACGGELTEPRAFNLMFKTFIGVTEDAQNQIYLRPETAGGIFVNFKNVMRASRGKLPFGIGQIGKAFRNEITPGNFIFRMREFEQMEYEFFCPPESADMWFKKWREVCFNFAVELGLDKNRLRLRDHDKEELCFYSAGTTDIEFNYPFGWSELWGIANRTNYDLSQHAKVSGQDLTYTDPFTNETYIPYVIEPSVGVDRMFLALLCSAYDVEQLENDERVVMRFNKKVAPIKIGVLPLSKKLEEPALEIFNKLSKNYRCEYDTTGSIGKRYRRQDEIGTPFCITVDFDTLEDNCVTVRERDSMKQERIKIDDLPIYFFKQFNE